MRLLLALAVTLPMPAAALARLKLAGQCPQRDVIFNRVPKSGSTTMQYLFKNIAEQNGFAYVNDKRYLTDYEPDSLMSPWEALNSSRAQIMELTDWAPQCEWSHEDARQPWLYVNHVYFTDFGGCTPYYVNIVREPVDQFASGYYFHLSNRPPARPDRSGRDDEGDLAYSFQVGINECIEVARGRRQKRQDVPPRVYETCMSWGTSPVEDVWSFLCGWSDECVPRDNNSTITLFSAMPLKPDAAFAKVKRNVEENYAAIGILELMDESLRVFEYVLPEFFRGISFKYMKDKEILQLEVKPYSATLKEAWMTPLSEENDAWLRSHLAFHVRVYAWLRERFEKTYASVMSGTYKLEARVCQTTNDFYQLQTRFAKRRTTSPTSRERADTNDYYAMLA